MSHQSFINAKQGIDANTNGHNNSFKSTKRFYDDANFPKGFKRCGDFTNKEADLLEQHGQAMKNLADGSQLPCNVDEDQFISVVQGTLPATTSMELLWSKYCRLAKGKPFYAVVGTIHAPAGSKVEIEFDDVEESSDSDEAE
ncbi:DUF413 domain-containing protein [Shewanella livingstonensis]|uniref:Macrodomain Ori protein n=1 Tax=Shewanella livingstonensis TaxID=150120 RepID=A0A3G8LWI7_9GAMM|nr:DUF413 domain-containing protein [Shewanella livingstonensis]AZG73754.1 DUF413 domain-containing protein [Shewanella livingstonensis]